MRTHPQRLDDQVSSLQLPLHDAQQGEQLGLAQVIHVELTFLQHRAETTQSQSRAARPSCGAAGLSDLEGTASQREQVLLAVAIPPAHGRKRGFFSCVISVTREHSLHNRWGQNLQSKHYYNYVNIVFVFQFPHHSPWDLNPEEKKHRKQNLFTNITLHDSRSAHHWHFRLI